MERVLITGGTGQLGHDVYLEVQKRFPNAKIFMPSRDYLDLTNKTLVEEIIKHLQPDVVFHCAAYTAVDKAEEEKDVCYETNVKGTEYITKACESIGAKLVYISTDYVFEAKRENLIQKKIRYIL